MAAVPGEQAFGEALPGFGLCRWLGGCHLFADGLGSALATHWRPAPAWDMTGKPRYGNPLPVGDVATGILDPMLRRKAGISTALVQSWEEIVGSRLAASTRPEKIVWPRRAGEDDPFQPATLVIACEGAAALRLQHETGEIIDRVNGFLGFGAVARIRIVQKPVAPGMAASMTFFMTLGKASLWMARAADHQ